MNKRIIALLAAGLLLASGIAVYLGTQLNAERRAAAPQVLYHAASLSNSSGDAQYLLRDLTRARAVDTFGETLYVYSFWLGYQSLSQPELSLVPSLDRPLALAGGADLMASRLDELYGAPKKRPIDADGMTFYRFVSREDYQEVLLVLNTPEQVLGSDVILRDLGHYATLEDNRLTVKLNLTALREAGITWRISIPGTTLLGPYGTEYSCRGGSTGSDGGSTNEASFDFYLDEGHNSTPADYKLVIPAQRQAVGEPLIWDLDLR